MEGADLCQEIVKRASSGFVYSEAVARYDSSLLSFWHRLAVKAIADTELRIMSHVSVVSDRQMDFCWHSGYGHVRTSYCMSEIYL